MDAPSDYAALALAVDARPSSPPPVFRFTATYDSAGPGLALPPPSLSGNALFRGLVPGMDYSSDPASETSTNCSTPSFSSQSSPSLKRALHQCSPNSSPRPARKKSRSPVTPRKNRPFSQRELEQAFARKSMEEDLAAMMMQKSKSSRGSSPDDDRRHRFF